MFWCFGTLNDHSTPRPFTLPLVSNESITGRLRTLAWCEERYHRSEVAALRGVEGGHGQGLNPQTELARDR